VNNATRSIPKLDTQSGDLLKVAVVASNKRHVVSATDGGGSQIMRLDPNILPPPLAKLIFADGALTQRCKAARIMIALDQQVAGCAEADPAMSCFRPPHLLQPTLRNCFDRDYRDGLPIPRDRRRPRHSFGIAASRIAKDIGVEGKHHLKKSASRSRSRASYVSHAISSSLGSFLYLPACDLIPRPRPQSGSSRMLTNSLFRIHSRRSTSIALITADWVEPRTCGLEAPSTVASNTPSVSAIKTVMDVRNLPLNLSRISHCAARVSSAM